MLKLTLLQSGLVFVLIFVLACNVIFVVLLWSDSRPDEREHVENTFPERIRLKSEIYASYLNLTYLQFKFRDVQRAPADQVSPKLFSRQIAKKLSRLKRELGVIEGNYSAIIKKASDVSSNLFLNLSKRYRMLLNE